MNCFVLIYQFYTESNIVILFEILSFTHFMYRNQQYVNVVTMYNNWIITFRSANTRYTFLLADNKNTILLYEQ